MQSGKPKFNKDKCAKCKFRFRSSFVLIGCNYATVTGHTCLRKSADGTIIDIRGNNYNHCRLFEEGARIREQDYEDEEQGSGGYHSEV